MEELLQRHESEQRKSMEMAEPAKIAADVLAALIGQIVEYLSRKCWEDKGTFLSDPQVISNIHHILLFANASTGYDGKSLVYPDLCDNFDKKLQSFTTAFTAWANDIAKQMEGTLCVLLGQINPLKNIERGGDCQAPALWPAGLEGPPAIRAAKINEAGFHRRLADCVPQNPIALPNRDKDIQDRLVTCLWNHFPSMCQNIARGLGLGPEKPHTVEPIIAEGSTKGYLLLCSLEPLPGSDTKEQEQARTNNPVVRLATAFYSAVLTERIADLSAYARGASHGLKNALTGAELLLGSVPQDAAHRFTQLLLPPRDNYLIQELLNSALSVQQEIVYLKDQSELFFWIMDPDRAQQDVSDRSQNAHRALSEVLTSAFLRGLELAIRRRSPEQLAWGLVLPVDAEPDWSAWKRAKTNLEEGLVRCRRTFAEEQKSGATQDTLQQLRALLNRTLRFDLHWPNPMPTGHVAGLTARILDAVLVELLQNAAKAAMTSNVSRPSVTIEATADGTSAATISVTNTASKGDLATVRGALGSDTKQRGPHVHGLRGLWQLELLCKRLAEGRVMLLPPKFKFETRSLTMSVRVRLDTP